MPPSTLFDISGLNMDVLIHDQESVREFNPQRGDFEQLNGIVYADKDLGRIVGIRNVGTNEFWIPGHIPGRPLLPGVLMIESAAQLASFFTKCYLQWKGFIGFGGVEKCKFRQQVTPGQRMTLIGQKMWERHGRICCDVQGVVEGQLAFETSIIGIQM